MIGRNSKFKMPSHKKQKLIFKRTIHYLWMKMVL